MEILLSSLIKVSMENAPFELYGNPFLVVDPPCSFLLKAGSMFFPVFLLVRQAVFVLRLSETGFPKALANHQTTVR